MTQFNFSEALEVPRHVNLVVRCYGESWNVACVLEMKVKVISLFMLTQEIHFSGTEQQLVEMHIQHFFLSLPIVLNGLLQRSPCGKTYAQQSENIHLLSRLSINIVVHNQSLHK